MPNIKSAKKRVVVSEKKAGVNKAFNTTVKTTLKKFDKALEAGDQAAVAAAHRDVGYLGMGNNPMVGATVAVAVAVEQAMK